MLRRIARTLQFIDRFRAVEARKRIRRKCGSLGDHFSCGPGTRLYLENARPEQIRFGNYVSMLETDVVCYERGRIHIGDYCWFSLRTQVVSAVGVTIGDYSIFARDVYISDTNEHPLDPLLRRKDTIAALQTGKPPNRYLADMRPVVIGRDVWVGERAVILKGVTIGDGAVVAANSVVTHDVPPLTVVAGSPAVAVKTIALSTACE